MGCCFEPRFAETDVGGSYFPHGEGCLVGGVDGRGDPSALADGAGQPCEGRAVTGHVYDCVDAIGMGRLYGGCQVCLAVVDGFRGSEMCEAGETLSAAACSDDMDAATGRKLDGVPANATGRAHDQECLSFLQGNGVEG